MTAHAVPECIRALGRLVPREHAGSRRPQQVTAGAFAARGMAIPADRRMWNSYQLSGRQGWEWSEAIDRHVRRIGAEVLTQNNLVLLDLDLTLDGDGIADLAALAASLGVVPDVDGSLVVASPGHGSHQPGRHVWFAADPSMPVRFGPLEGWPRIEVKSRGTCPGSPGYRVLREPPAELAMFPRWLARVAGPPKPAAGTLVRSAGTHGEPSARLRGVADFVATAQAGDGRNSRLFWASVRAGEMVRAGEVDRGTAELALLEAAELCGHSTKHGQGVTRSTIASGMARAGAAA